MSNLFNYDTHIHQFIKSIVNLFSVGTPYSHIQRYYINTIQEQKVDIDWKFKEIMENQEIDERIRAETKIIYEDYLKQYNSIIEENKND